MGYEIAVYMHVGKRANQEDCLFVNGNIIQEDLYGPVVEDINADGPLILAVCDGMGGLLDGEWASRFVCEYLAGIKDKLVFSMDFIDKTIKDIQTHIEKEQRPKCGTTLAGILIQDGRSIVFNVGDSRVYKFQEDGFKLLSHDHSFVQYYLDRGEITEQEAINHVYKNVIDFGLGDVFKPSWDKSEYTIYFAMDTFKAGEFYLICTDGVNDVMRNEEIYAILTPDPVSTLPYLVDIIRERMKDNISMILIGNKG